MRRNIIELKQMILKKKKRNDVILLPETKRKSTESVGQKNWNINQTFWDTCYVVWFLPHIAHIWCLSPKPYLHTISYFRLKNKNIAKWYKMSGTNKKIYIYTQKTADIEMIMTEILILFTSFLRVLQSLLSWNFNPFQR